MYLNGSGSTASNGTDQGSNRSAGGPSGSYAWHRGNMSKRFDGKDEPPSTTPKPAAVRHLLTVMFGNTKPTLQPAIKSAVTKDDEAAAMAAMFQASAANWEETQERLSQLVSPESGFLCPSSSSTSSNELISCSFPSLSLPVVNRL